MKSDKIKTYALTNNIISLNGKYWIGDPCYVIPDDLWSKLCDDMFPNHNEPLFDDRNVVRVLEFNNKKAYCFGTAYGDGTYPLYVHGTLKEQLGVDAGMLSMIPAELLDLPEWGESKNAGIIINVKFDEKLIGVTDGDFTAGYITINTSDNEFDDYYEGDEDFDN